ncbi:high-affinity nickel-transport protein [Isoptericola jiangsuensis]|uniref:Nickel/cobalt efflux system n=1 Tax=Isoptericola jiangsuensis TaxID=548579 RepID=A0A2A9EVR1_9MICO|nr:high-affinity nickel-transport protein [Isoptericola jiangsuensis]PFG42249.1 high-affinity nickel-transport protein [Isoptericola jiangsuensis]
MTTATPTTHRSVTVPVVVGLHVAALAALAATFLAGGAGALTWATALTAYGLGLRHAFDPDHIAAIDNTTRRLVRTGRDPHGVGLWFSLGHSTVVVVSAALLAVGVAALAGMMDDDGSLLRRVTGLWGPLVASTFLLVLGTINVVLLRRALRTRRAVGDRTSAVRVGGPVSWALRRFEWATDRPRRMYGVGLLFGLGFDTATSVGLLATATAVTLEQQSWVAAVPLALLFASGMSLLDSAQGSVARRVYAGAPGATGGRPGTGYDVVVTGASALAAFGIAVLTLVQTLAESWSPAAGLPGAAADLDPYGFVLTGLLVVVWGVGVLVLRRQSRGEPGQDVAAA